MPHHLFVQISQITWDIYNLTCHMCKECNDNLQLPCVQPKHYANAERAQHECLGVLSYNLPLDWEDPRQLWHAVMAASAYKAILAKYINP